MKHKICLIATCMFFLFLNIKLYAQQPPSAVEEKMIERQTRLVLYNFECFLNYLTDVNYSEDEKKLMTLGATDTLSVKRIFYKPYNFVNCQVPAITGGSTEIKIVDFIERYKENIVEKIKFNYIKFKYIGRLKCELKFKTKILGENFDGLVSLKLDKIANKYWSSYINLIEFKKIEGEANIASLSANEKQIVDNGIFSIVKRYEDLLNLLANEKTALVVKNLIDNSTKIADRIFTSGKVIVEDDISIQSKIVNDMEITKYLKNYNLNYVGKNSPAVILSNIFIEKVEEGDEYYLATVNFDCEYKDKFWIDNRLVGLPINRRTFEIRIFKPKTEKDNWKFYINVIKFYQEEKPIPEIPVVAAVDDKSNNSSTANTSSELKTSNVSEDEKVDVNLKVQNVIRDYENVLNELAQRPDNWKKIVDNTCTGDTRIFQSASVKVEYDLGFEKLKETTAANYLQKILKDYPKQTTPTIKFKDTEVISIVGTNILYTAQVAFICEYGNLQSIKSGKKAPYIVKRIASVEVKKKDGRWYSYITKIETDDTYKPEEIVAPKPEDVSKATPTTQVQNNDTEMVGDNQEREEEEVLPEVTPETNPPTPSSLVSADTTDVASNKEENPNTSGILAPPPISPNGTDTIKIVVPGVPIEQPLKPAKIPDIPYHPLFGGFNYNLVGNGIQGKMGGALYGKHLGVYFNRFKQYKAIVPAKAYSTIDIQLIQEYLGDANIEFTPLIYSYSSQQLKTWEAGLYLPLIAKRMPFTKQTGRAIWKWHIYAMAGIAHLQGYMWDIYKGDAAGFLEPVVLTVEATQFEYAVNLYPVKNIDFIVGGAFVMPFVQIEAGYNRLFNDFYCNAGVNIPFHLLIKAKQK